MTFGPDAAGPSSEKLHVAAAMLASSVIGAPLVIAGAVRLVLATINPRGLDLGDPLAYAPEVAATFFAAAALAIVAVVIVLSRLKRLAADRAVLRVPYLVLATQIAFAAVTLTLSLFTP